MGDADLSAVFYGKKKDETTPAVAAPTDQVADQTAPAAPPAAAPPAQAKERKHILSVKY